MEQLIYLFVGIVALLIAVFLSIKENMKTRLTNFRMSSPDISFGNYAQDENMLYVYCYDRKLGYCFSLVRLKNVKEIEIMVLDQINEKIDDVDITLTRKCLIAKLDRELALRLDKKKMYTIQFELSDEKYRQLTKTLVEIFEGKQGLKIA
jgi:hypothetical protein